MQIIETIIILLPIIAMCIRNEKRMTRLETNIEWIIKKLNGEKP
jgi:hypothetical protein